MTIDNQQGPLTPEQLQDIWESAVDQSFSAPLIMAGEGQGFEVYTQAFEQIARLSQAVDYTTQALYILPWSGQSGLPAAGQAYATVTLTFERDGFSGQTLILKAGQIFVDEVQNDYGTDGSVPTNTGRTYTLLEDLYFLPGEMGPYNVTAQAVKPGYGYNNPLPGSLTLVENPGTGLYNDLATLTGIAGAPTTALPPPIQSYTLTAFNETDMLVPSNVGQFLLFTAGANAGQTALITSFISPNTPPVVPATGSGVTLQPLITFESFGGSFVNNLVVGAQVQFTPTAGTPIHAFGTLLAVTPAAGGNYKLAVLLTQGALVIGGLHPTSEMFQFHAPPAAATSMAVSVIYQTGALTPEAPSGVPLSGGASWRILDWVKDWQLTCTNAASPTGGVLGMLDLIGRERNLPRINGEVDAIYRERLAIITDVVTPNAIKRALNKALGALPWCYRETSNGLLPGFFYDRGVNPAEGQFSNGDHDGDFYDNDMILWEGTWANMLRLEVGMPIQYQRQVPASTGPWLVMATGIFGGIISSSGLVLEFIRKTGQAFEPMTGDRIVNPATAAGGAAFLPTSNLPNDNALMTAWHVYLDYASFRAYFVVELPALDYGEFGFAYDDHPFGAYDASPFLDFYDGFPAGSSPVYLSVYNQLNKIRAGGVSFDLFLAQGPCV
jgi:hypothetical protein